MKINYAVAALATLDVTTVKCVFGEGREYEYLTTRKLKKTLKVGDLVLVDRFSKGNCDLTVVKVSDLNDSVTLDITNPYTPTTWAISKVEILDHQIFVERSASLAVAMEDRVRNTITNIFTMNAIKGKILTAEELVNEVNNNNVDLGMLQELL